jgi:hypothetical protein
VQNGIFPWLATLGLQRNEVPNSYQDMKKGAKCMEDGFMFHKSGGAKAITQKVETPKPKDVASM